MYRVQGKNKEAYGEVGKALLSQANMAAEESTLPTMQSQTQEQTKMSFYGMLDFYACFIVIGIMTVVAHEMAHIGWFENNKGRKVSARWDKKSKSLVVGKPKDYKDLTKREYREMLGDGILAGFGVIVMSGVLHPFYWIWVVPYLAWCIPDFVNYKNAKNG